MRCLLVRLFAAFLFGSAIPAMAEPRAEGPLRGASCPSVPTDPLTLPASRAALREGRPLTILAFGSSSTEGAGASTPEASYPARLAARLRAAMPRVRLSVLNRGKGGQEAPEMLARLEADVLAAQPTLVIWQAGANAVLRGIDPAAFRAAMALGLARLRASGADVVLMDSQQAPRILAVPNHEQYPAVLAELAATQHLSLFSRGHLMQRWRAAGTPAADMLIDDGLHHNDRGYDCLAAALAGSITTALQPSTVMALRR
jgi:acyl-CoA thioesterase I